MELRVEEFEHALNRHASNGGEAIVLAERIFDCIRALLHKLNPDIPFLQLDLLLADLQRDFCEELFDLVLGTIDRDIAMNIFAHLFGED
jgi:hypothetical protein